MICQTYLPVAFFLNTQQLIERKSNRHTRHIFKYYNAPVIPTGITGISTISNRLYHNRIASLHRHNEYLIFNTQKCKKKDETLLSGTPQHSNTRKKAFGESRVVHPHLPHSAESSQTLTSGAFFPLTTPLLLLLLPPNQKLNLYHHFTRSRNESPYSVRMMSARALPSIEDASNHTQSP